MAPHSAALLGLYTPHSSANKRRYSYFYMMANGDMTTFVRVLLGLPFPQTSEADSLKKRIGTLPRYLRASGSHKSPSPVTGKVQPGYLCDLHRNLKKGLCYEIMSMVQREISRIGRFTHSVIMSGELEAWEEMQARQLEPVPQMYVPHFDPHARAPQGHDPVFPGVMDEKGVLAPRWGYEASQCPACMLSRIGSAREVLSALLAGLVARTSRRRRGHRESLVSRRVRFVKEWLEACKEGEVLVEDSFLLGGRMREIKRGQKKRAREQRAREALDIRIDVSREQRVFDRPGTTIDVPRRLRVHGGQENVFRVPEYRESVTGIDICNPYVPQSYQASTHSALKAHPFTDQDSANGIVISESFHPRSSSLGPHVSSNQENFLPHQGTRATSRGSEGSIQVGFDTAKHFNSKSKQPGASQRAVTPVREKARRSGMVTDKSTHDRISIASSFASNVSLSHLRAPDDTLSLFPDPLRTPSRRPPSIGARSVNRLLRPHPLSTYGANDQSETHTAARYADVSPPDTPMVRGYPTQRVNQYNTSPPSSPEWDEFELIPWDTPVMRSRPVTTWSALYDKPTFG